VFGLEKVDQKPYNSSIKPMESMSGLRVISRLLPTMERELRGKKFRSDQKIKTACSAILLKLVTNGLQHVFEKWVDVVRSASLAKGGTSKKRPVTAPSQSSDLE
jgi:hypothetical protein